MWWLCRTRENALVEPGICTNEPVLSFDFRSILTTLEAWTEAYRGSRDSCMEIESSFAIVFPGREGEVYMLSVGRDWTAQKTVTMTEQKMKKM